MDLPWLKRVPSFEEVEAHEKAYPSNALPLFGGPPIGGEWLIRQTNPLSDRQPGFVRLHAARPGEPRLHLGRGISLSEPAVLLQHTVMYWEPIGDFARRLHYLPVDAEGIPVCLLPVVR